MPFAMDVALLPAVLHERLWLTLGEAPAGRPLEELVTALADRKRTRTLLLGLPALALLGLEAICAAQGSIERKRLERAIARHSRDPNTPSQCITLLRGHGLCISNGTGPKEMLVLLAPRAQVIAELLLGVTPAPELPPEPPSAPEILAHERDVLAVAALAVHRRLKMTREGGPNKTSLKAFSRGLGPDEARIEQLLMDARHVGILEAREDAQVEANAPAMRKAARNGLPHLSRSLFELVDSLLPEAGWAPAAFFLPHVRQYGGLNSGRDLMARCAGKFVFREHGGEVFLARPPRPRERTGDGHVTPNFEVMVGPEAHPDVAVVIGLFCELVRLDRVLTYRITEASVHAGLRTGYPLRDLQDALVATGRHGVPENVAITVRDFAARVSTIRPVWALEVPPAAALLLEQELGAAFIGSPAPGLVLVSSLVSEQDVAFAMSAVGLKPVAAVDVVETHEPARAYRIPRRATPDAALCDLVDGERQSAFRESLRTLAGSLPVLERRNDQGAERAVADARANLGPAAPPILRLALAQLATLIAGLPKELEAWASLLTPGRAADVRRHLEDPLALVPVASVLPELRDGILQNSHSWSELVRRCQEPLKRGRFRPEALIVMQTFPAREGSATAGEDGPDPSSERITPGATFAGDLRQLIQHGECIKVAVRKGNAFLVNEVSPTAIVRRGNELVLLAEDLVSRENHAFPLTKIAWVDFDRGALDGDSEGLEDDDTEAPMPN